MKAECVPKKLRSLSNVLQDQLNNVLTSRAEQPDDISCSVVPQAFVDVDPAELSLACIDCASAANYFLQVGQSPFKR